MRTALLLTIMALVLSVEASAQFQDLAGEAWPLAIEDEDEPGSPGRLRVAVLREVVNLTSDRVDGMIGVDDGSLALAAGWENVRRKSIKEGGATRQASFDEKAVQRFFGLVEGRTRVPIPAGWEKLVLSGRWSSEGGLHLPIHKMVEAGSPKLQKPALEDQVWNVKLGERIVAIPESCVDRNLAWTTCFETDDGVTYFVLHNGRARSCYLHRLDKDSSVPEWRTVVWCTTGTMTLTGSQPSSQMWISISKAEVVVFSASTFCFSIESFDKKSGRSLARLLSECLDIP